jgi:hypothetical protein
MLFLGCLPLWGREGVILIACLRMVIDRISTEPIFPVVPLWFTVTMLREMIYDNNYTLFACFTFLPQPDLF